MRQGLADNKDRRLEPTPSATLAKCTLSVRNPLEAVGVIREYGRIRCSLASGNRPTGAPGSSAVKAEESATENWHHRDPHVTFGDSVLCTGWGRFWLSPSYQTWRVRLHAGRADLSLLFAMKLEFTPCHV